MRHSHSGPDESSQDLDEHVVYPSMFGQALALFLLRVLETGCQEMWQFQSTERQGGRDCR